MQFEIDIRDSAAIRAISGREPPNILFHYTSRSGLLQILESRSIWASHLRYLNDTQEFSFAVSVAQQVLQNCNPDSELEGALLAQLEAFLRHLEQQTSVYVFSTSEDGNLLSQWRAYCRPSDGYAIGFDTLGLTKKMSAQGVFLAQCEYDGDLQRDVVNQLLDETRQELSRLLSTDLTDQAAIARAVSYFLVVFHVVAPVLKHAAFQEEQEWRLISHPFASKQELVRFRAGDTLLVPYRVLTLGEPPEALPIAEVVIGPTAHWDLEWRAMMDCLRLMNEDDIRVRGSQIPYRES